jgi:hypothetical protein
MLDLIPNAEKIYNQKENANGTMIAQVIIFYIGVAAFLLVCCIPPFTVFLPIFVPIVMMVVVYVNLAFMGKNIDMAVTKTLTLANNTKKMVVDSMVKTAQMET